MMLTINDNNNPLTVVSNNSSTYYNIMSWCLPQLFCASSHALLGRRVVLPRKQQKTAVRDANHKTM